MIASLLILALAGDPQGSIVVVGGGTTTPAITKRTLQLAGASARVLVIPQASERSDGSASAGMWRELGATSVSVLDPSDPVAAVKSVQQADLIWMPGGDQNRLMKVLSPTGVPEAIRKRFQAGAVVGGTSAGAAVLSQIMITGEAELDRIRRGATQTAEGLALWRRAIVDQHFVKRQRFNRLLSAVMDRPDLVGVGVDESTAAIVRGSKVEVVGSGQVLVIDARKAAVASGKAGDLSAATDIQLHVLTSGMTFDLGPP
jgi:cyanophycinase